MFPQNISPCKSRNLFIIYILVHLFFLFLQQSKLLCLKKKKNKDDYTYNILLCALCSKVMSCNIGIKHGFSCINICQRMTNQNVQTNRHGPQNIGCNRASADSKHYLVSKLHGLNEGNIGRSVCLGFGKLTYGAYR